MFEVLDAALGEGSILLQQSASSIDECFELAGSALVASNRTKPEYTNEMLEVFKDLGPYMVIAPNIALVHARPGASVLTTGLSLVTLTQPIEFGSKKFDPVKIVVGLSAVDHDGHIDLMAALSEFLVNVTNVNFLLQATKEAEVRALFR
jgi:PTS system ascorbate-specific IIA component